MPHYKLVAMVIISFSIPDFSCSGHTRNRKEICENPLARPCDNYMTRRYNKHKNAILDIHQNPKTFTTNHATNTVNVERYK